MGELIVFVMVPPTLRDKSGTLISKYLLESLIVALTKEFHSKSLNGQHCCLEVPIAIIKELSYSSACFAASPLRDQLRKV